MISTRLRISREGRSGQSEFTGNGERLGVDPSCPARVPWGKRQVVGSGVHAADVEIGKGF